MKDTIDEMLETITTTLIELDKTIDDNPMIKGLILQQKLKQHLIAITKDRSLVLSGDTNHMSVDHIVTKLFGDIDKPRKYDFQDLDENEKNVHEALVRIAVNPLRLHIDYTEEQLDAAIAGTTPLTISNKNHYDGYKCYDCTKTLRLTLDGSKVYLDAETPCENNKKFCVEIDFPTGEIVFADWPDRFGEAKSEGIIVDDNDESINYIKGQRQSTDSYAAKQIFFHSVGNSSPSWYYNKDTNQIQIGGEVCEAEPEDEDAEWDEDGKVPEGFEKKGYFCTDLWWVTMLDRKFYDKIISLIPGKRPKNDWVKELETAQIEPGRYRFTCYGDIGDGDYGTGRAYATAERIGDCSGQEPNYAPGGDNVILTAEQAILVQSQKYSILYEGEYDEVKFEVLDHTFNVLGNGINDKGGFIEHFSVKADTVIPTEFKVTEGKRDKYGFERNPYPNFNKKYSLIWTVKSLDFLDDTWIDAAIWFYEQCKEYFKGDTSNYSNAYPNKRERNLKEEFQKIIDGMLKKGMSTQEHWDAVTKHFIGDTEYRGDVEDYLTRRWVDNKVEIDNFINATLTKLAKEKKKRKKS